MLLPLLLLHWMIDSLSGNGTNSFANRDKDRQTQRLKYHQYQFTLITAILDVKSSETKSRYQNEAVQMVKSSWFSQRD